MKKQKSLKIHIREKFLKIRNYGTVLAINIGKLKLINIMGGINYANI